MSTGTLTLTDFLLARLREEQAYEWAASGLRAEAFTHTQAFREVEAKRTIVEAVDQDWHVKSVRDRTIEPQSFVLGMGEAMTFVVKQMASVYVDHPDYQQDWRP